MPKKIRVGVIFGGRSGEHEVSVRSAQSIIRAIDKKKFDVVPIAISKEGKWLAPDISAALLPPDLHKSISVSGSARSGEIALLGDPSYRGLISLLPKGPSSSSQVLDIIFPVIHGTFGEDGTLQGLLELANVPYVGCGVLASACGMDKVTMKSLFVQTGLPICKYVWFLRSQWERNPSQILRKVQRELGLPCFVKPANLGSSVGVSRAQDRKSLIEAIELASEYDRKIIVEEEVVAREIECAILGNDEPQASLPGEYVIYEESARFLDYTEKYTKTGNVNFVVPAPLSQSITRKIQRMAIRAFQAVDGAGLARVDFFLDSKNRKLLINELNTMPGLTDVSGYPKMWQASGLSFPSVLGRLIDLAFERHREKSITKTSL